MSGHIYYKVSIPNPNDHYVFVEMTFDPNGQESAEVYMPVWTPGSYMIREFSKNLDMFKAVDSLGNPLVTNKITKNRWKIETKGHNVVKVSYRVYAFELSVRTSFVDDSHATLNGASIFLGLEGPEAPRFAHHIEIVPRPEWKVISNTLEKEGNDWKRVAYHYDLLVDSPFEIGNHEEIPFDAAGVKHTLALVGPSNIYKIQVVKDLQAIIAQQAAVFNTEHPCEQYLFLVIHTEKTYGGLEHLNSSCNMVPRWNYAPRDKYLQSISLLSHEYFHLWNVKRIRPLGLGPFNYNQENHTKHLWVSEGFTNYFDNYFVYRAGVSTKEEYLGLLAEDLNIAVNTPGNQYQSLAESSYDAWIKYYRQNENSNNTQVSYYTKGGTVALALNAIILDATNGEKSLNDVMRQLYSVAIGDPQRGFRDRELWLAFELTAGKSLKPFFDDYVFGTKPLDYAQYLKLCGLELVNTNDSSQVYLGWTTQWKEGKLTVNKVEAGCSAQVSGLSAEDEILAIDGFRVMEGFEKLFKNKKPGETIQVLISRAGIISTIPVVLKADHRVKYQIIPIEKPTAKQAKIRKAWLGF
jgi:predicted metalloprotease with PDZ domain